MGVEKLKKEKVKLLANAITKNIADVVRVIVVVLDCSKDTANVNNNVNDKNKKLPALNNSLLLLE
jgi:hypothetical protein